MAESNVNIDKAVQIFGEIVKRKTIYNETNLHFEYFRLVGDTIPFKDLGYESLQQFIKINAAHKFYFEKVGNDFEFIAPKRIDSPPKQMDFESPSTSGLNKLGAIKQIFETPEKCPIENTRSHERTGITVVKHVAKNLNHDSLPRSNVCVSRNIRFSTPSSTGLNNSHQKFRNDIRISVNVNTKTRAVDCKAMDIDAKSMPMDAFELTELGYAENDNETFSGDNCVDLDSLPFVEYPWNDRYWHLKITNPVSTNKIWAHFYDEFEYDMRKLSVKLMRAVQADSSNPGVCDTHKIYVVKIDNQYYRARISHYEVQLDQCKCFLIDVGTTNWYDLTNVFRCPFELQQIRPMAIRLKLEGLVQFKENRNARTIIVQELSQKVVWARIQTKKGEFVGSKSITVILFDSLDREKRVNICSEIMEQLIETFLPPRLLRNSTNNVVISHISKVMPGVIYCHLLYNENELKFLNDLVEAFVAERKELSFKNVDSETELQKTTINNVGKLYLIYSKGDKKWYRATILQLEFHTVQPKPGNLMEYCFAYCFMVDYGNTRCTPLYDIYELHGMLSKYPFLAIAMELHNVHMTRKKIYELKQLLPSGSKAMVDFVETINNDDPNKTKSISIVRMTMAPSGIEDLDETDINKLLE